MDNEDESEAYGTPLEQIAPQVSDMMNYKAQNEWNIAEKLEDVFSPTNRDGLGILKVPFVEETETKRDILLFESVDEFTARFPTAEDAGMEKGEYDKVIQKIQADGRPDTPVKVPIEFEAVTYSGPKAKVVELIDFVTFRQTARILSAEHCKGYGELFTLRKGAIKAKGRSGAWDKDAVKRIQIAEESIPARITLKRLRMKLRDWGEPKPMGRNSLKSQSGSTWTRTGKNANFWSRMRRKKKRLWRAWTPVSNRFLRFVPHF